MRGDGGFGMRKTVLLGLLIVGIALIALSQSGALVPNTPCNDNGTFYPRGMCRASFPWATLTALVSGIVVLVAGFLLYLGGRDRRQEVGGRN
jgi:hypothetical protein